MIIAVVIARHNFYLAAFLFIIPIVLWWVKEGVEIDPLKNSFRKVLYLQNFRIGKWFSLEGIRYASAMKIPDSEKWSVNLHFSESKYYRLFKADKANCEAEADKINQILDQKAVQQDATNE